MPRRSKRQRIIPYKGPLTLTGNDLALAEMGLIHAVRWHRLQQKRHGRNSFTSAEIAKLEALRRKLSAIGDHAYPYEQTLDGSSPDEYGDEQIMRMDTRQVGVTRRAAQRFNRTHPV